jgi:hypothetical protein
VERAREDAGVGPLVHRHLQLAAPRGSGRRAAPILIIVKLLLLLSWVLAGTRLITHRRQGSWRR